MAGSLYTNCFSESKFNADNSAIIKAYIKTIE